MSQTLFVNARIVNEGELRKGDLLVEDGRIVEIGENLSAPQATVIDCAGKILMPGVIDDQVHFREPGLTHKAELATESLAAAAGGTTSFMDMPNVKPASLTQELLEERYVLASNKSAVNYSFYMGASNDNLEEVLKTDPKTICGIKAFMGSSTGNMLVDDRSVLDQLFEKAPCLIATHCEDETTVRASNAAVKAAKGDSATAWDHPDARPREGCVKSSELAKELALKHNTRLHILHITTAEEARNFTKGPVKGKRITSEACVHHLTYEREDYKRLGNKIKCNPAIKEASDRDAVFAALLNDQIDVIATDHAPHTVEEKSKHYWEAPGGVPLVQHSLLLMHEHVKAGRITWERLVEKMCHAVTDCFEIKDRGYLRPGYWADIVLFDEETPYVVDQHPLYSKCGWSPFEGHTFPGSVAATYVNGVQVYDGKEAKLVKGAGARLAFDR
ncbi:MAG: dihydroorotase [Saprospiraceae bacterium]